LDDFTRGGLDDFPQGFLHVAGHEDFVIAPF